MKGDPKLTQRKIDKLRDALNVVLETDQIQEDPVLRSTLEAMRPAMEAAEDWYLKPKEAPSDASR